jgi:hypothetical protein
MLICCNPIPCESVCNKPSHWKPWSLHFLTKYKGIKFILDDLILMTDGELFQISSVEKREQESDCSWRC